MQMQNVKLHLLAGLRYTHSHLGHGTIVTGSHSAALRRVLYPRSLSIGGGCANQEAKCLQPLVSVASVCLEIRGVRFTCTAPT